MKKIRCDAIGEKLAGLLQDFCDAFEHSPLERVIILGTTGTTKPIFCNDQHKHDRRSSSRWQQWGGEVFFHEPMGNAIGMLTQVAPFCENEMPNVWAG
jgi:hypothetical protein